MNRNVLDQINMANKKALQETCVLIWNKGVTDQFIAEGTRVLMNYKKAELMKQPQYSSGKLLVMSKSAYKYNHKPNLK